MNTSIIKEEAAKSDMQADLKISRRHADTLSVRKNDLVTLLREENDSLYQEYREMMKRNTELRAIVEKQQKLINAIYRSELKLILPAEETGLVKNEQAMFPVVQENNTTNNLPVEVKPAEPLSINDLAKRICKLSKKQWQARKTLVEKTKFLLAIYHEPGGIHRDRLFGECRITDITGNRYVAFFRKFGLVGRGGVYKITEQGKKFVEGEPNPEWDKNLIKKWMPMK